MLGRTNIVLDKELVKRGKKITGIKTSRELVDHALKELVRMGDQKQILELHGKIKWEGDLNAMRKARTFR